MKTKLQISLDRSDRRILDELQRDGALSAAEVAAKLGLSTTTCWRRIQQLEESGVIKQRVALLDREALGLDVMVYVNVRLSTQGRDALAQFEKAIRDRPEVLDCCTLTGEWDFCLRIVTHDMKEYEAFFLDHLSKIPNVQSVNSSIVVTVIKESTVLPLARAKALIRKGDSYEAVWLGSRCSPGCDLGPSHVGRRFRFLFRRRSRHVWCPGR
ncbi:MAG: AsnC family transcriptional regulator [Steroidobacteraceae bacterium]|nr:AsnC family transcriptional regulator [Steroidobacteraceae bacterium]